MSGSEVSPKSQHVECPYNIRKTFMPNYSACDQNHDDGDEQLRYTISKKQTIIKPIWWSTTTTTPYMLNLMLFVFSHLVRQIRLKKVRDGNPS